VGFGDAFIQAQDVPDLNAGKASQKPVFKGNCLVRGPKVHQTRATGILQKAQSHPKVAFPLGGDFRLRR
jgi:hypothetical protein